MNTLTKTQRIIATIYVGSAYSAFRDNSLSELKLRAEKYLQKTSSQALYSPNGGGFGLMIMDKVLSGNWNYDGKNIDDTLSKTWLAIAIGFETVSIVVKVTPKIFLSVVRLFAAPTIKDLDFAKWVAQYQSELFSHISLIKGLENINESDNIYGVLFEE